jgi:hypothetical protein
MEKKLKIGQVVWAKIKGYPWWPGMVSIKYNLIDSESRQRRK